MSDIFKKAKETDIAGIRVLDSMAVFNSDKKTAIARDGDEITYLIHFEKNGKDYEREFTINMEVWKNLPLNDQALLVKKSLGDARNDFSSAIKTAKEIEEFIAREVKKITSQKQSVQEKIVKKVKATWK